MEGKRQAMVRNGFFRWQMKCFPRLQTRFIQLAYFDSDAIAQRE
jgi:hypothetical protein